MNEDFCGGREERPASAAKAYWSMPGKRDADLTRRERKKTVQNPVTMAERPHLFPSRTQQLSSHASKVLGWKRPGRIDCCRSQRSPRTLRAGAFSMSNFRLLLFFGESKAWKNRRKYERFCQFFYTILIVMMFRVKLIIIFQHIL